jgi:hypothetical protein
MRLKPYFLPYFECISKENAAIYTATAYIEILGMNDKYDYAVRTVTKINGFSRDKYRPEREIIYILVYNKNIFDEDYFVSQVLIAFDMLIPDSALIWDKKTVASY